MMVHIEPALVEPFHSCISDDDTRKQRSHPKRPSEQPNPGFLLCCVPKAIALFFIFFFLAAKPRLDAAITTYKGRAEGLAGVMATTIMGWHWWTWVELMEMGGKKWV